MTPSPTRRDLLAAALSASAVAAAPGRALATRRSRAQETAAAGENLQAELETALERHDVVGASVAIFHAGLMTTAAAGVVNLETGVEMTADTVMHIGSITKLLNVSLVMQLVDEGKLDLAAPVVDYLPDFAVQDAAATRAITVGMLLNHTSGIDGEMIPDAGPDQESIRQAVERCADLGQIHAPGKDCSYCNAAMVVAGYLAEKIEGKSWYLLMEERIFERLGLTQSIVQPADALLHRASVGHFRNQFTGAQKRTSHVFLPLSLAPAGSTAMMSARDLVRFAVAHLHGGLGLNGERLLSEESTTAMQTRTASMQGFGADQRSFGLGFMIGPEGDLGHGGGGPGILSWVTLIPEKDFAMAVLTNSSHGMTVGAELTNAWTKKATGIEPLPSVRHPPVERAFDPERYAGIYESVAAEFAFTKQGDDLALSARAKLKAYDDTSTLPSPRIPLDPVGENAFVLRLPDSVPDSVPRTLVTFVNPDSQGRFEHISSGGRLYRRRS